MLHNSFSLLILDFHEENNFNFALQKAKTMTPTGTYHFNGWHFCHGISIKSMKLTQIMVLKMDIIDQNLSLTWHKGPSIIITICISNFFFLFLNISL